MHISEKSVVEDTRKIDLLKGQISTYQTKVDEMSKKLDKVKATRNKFIGGFLALGIGLLILIYIRFN
jgi:peptidoglycan hydrolase CwlO-like protein